MTAFKDYYQVLGVAKAATPEDIKRAYRKLARKHHPDMSKEADATQRMVELNEANAVLSDPEKRAAYDTLMSEPQGRSGQDFRPPPHWDDDFNFSSAAGLGPEHSDFFEQLFGSGARARRGHEGATTPRRGSDQHARIEMTLRDAYQGVERTLSLRGDHMEEQQLLVSVPKGVYQGQQIRLAGRGHAGIGGGAPGDLLLEVHFKPDPVWRTDGRHVHGPLALAPWEAMLGASVVVRGPDGELDITVPAGWTSGRKLRLKGRGIPGKTPGDLFLEMLITLPEAHTESDRAAYAALAAAFPTFAPRLKP